MKKFFSIIMLLAVTLISAQETKGWSYGAGLSLHTIADESADLENLFFGADANVTYNFNGKLGLGGYFGYDGLETYNVNTKDYSEFSLFRFNLELESDILALTELDTKNLMLIVHGGPGITYSTATEGFFPNMSGGVTGVYMFSKKLGVKLDWTVTGNFMQGKNLDGIQNVSSVGINSFVNNASVGLIWRPKMKRYTDRWDRLSDRVAKLNRMVSELEKKSITPAQVINNNTTLEVILDVLNEHIFFKEDSYRLEQSELNALVNVIEYLDRNPNVSLEIVGSSCSKHATPEYNQILSEKRAAKVYERLVRMGVPSDRLSHRGVGNDARFSEDDSDAQRRVDFFVIN